MSAELEGRVIVQKVSKIPKKIAMILGAISMLIGPVLANEADPASAAVNFSANVTPSTIEQSTPVADEKFQALHAAWGGNTVPTANLSIPSISPVTKVDISSYYGYRTDPFRGRRKNHKGLDIRGPVGTPIYATADGFVKMSKWLGSYGKFIELDHGNAITTRYGHMSRLNVSANTFVKKGDVIGFMGSTGRSTGSHLHYEVRVSGQPVNPLSFMSHNNNVTRIANKSSSAPAQGGPAQ